MTSYRIRLWNSGEYLNPKTLTPEDQSAFEKDMIDHLIKDKLIPEGTVTIYVELTVRFDVASK